MGLAIAVLAAGAVPSYAGNGYGPPGPPGPPGVPGGFERDVVAVRTVGSFGGKLLAEIAGGVRVEVTVPPGAFRGPVQIAITAPPIFELNGILSRVDVLNYYVVTAFGLEFADRRGQPKTGEFLEPVSVSLNGVDLGLVGEKLLELTSGTSATELAASLGDHLLTFSVQSDPDLLVANPSPPGTRGRHSSPPPIHRHGSVVQAIMGA